MRLMLTAQTWQHWFAQATEATIAAGVAIVIALLVQIGRAHV